MVIKLLSIIVALLLAASPALANGYSSGGTNVSNASGTLPVANGGTASTTAADARTALSAAKSGANSDITSVSGLTTPLSMAQGGTGTNYHEPNRALLGNAVSAFITPYVIEGRTMTVLTGDTTINAASVYTIVYCDTTSGTFTLTLRTADNFDVGKMFIIRNVGSNNLSVANTDTGTVTLAAGGFMMVHRRTGDNWTVVMKGSSS